MDDKERLPKHRAGSEERLLAVAVGAIEPHNAPITLEPYNPQWSSRYAVLEAQIRDALGLTALMIEHVGSTSVPGLAAKPIIDIVLAVPDSADEDAYAPLLDRLGYKLKFREPDWFEHRLLKSVGIDGNIHVFSQGCEEIERMLAFRDWLRSNDSDRQLYQRAKCDLALRRWTYVQDYADAKTDVVKEILGRALRAKRNQK
jgi:GrpB-like predicted nucleotidyltransferase (UPF0157 family)